MTDEPLKIVLPANVVVRNRDDYRKLATDAIAQGVPVQFDFANCGYTDSSALAMLLRVARASEASKLPLPVFLNVNEDLVNLLRLTKLDHFFTVNPK